MSPTSYQLLYPAMFGKAKVALFPENPKLIEEGQDAGEVVFGEAALLSAL